MTRINVGIKPAELSNKHLIAEHREIKRIPNIFKNKLSKNMPEQFKLGTGHVIFFYDKMLYLKKRYIEIYNECLKRNFNVTNFVGAWDKVDKQFMNDYKETSNDRKLLIQRLFERDPIFYKSLIQEIDSQ